MNDYVQILRNNNNFRYLFTARGISLFGDWVNLIAIFTIINQYITDSALIYSWVIVLKMLPHFILSPVAGVVADRFNKKSILIFSDLLRVAVVLCIFLVPFFPNIWFIYLLLLLQASLSTFFEPARSALIPELVPARDLVKANTVSSLMWSLMLTFGSAVGGIITEAFGWKFVIALDALSYIISALIIGLMSMDTDPYVDRSAKKSGLADYKELFQYLGSHPRIFHMSMLKAFLCFGGASQLILTIFGQKIFTFGKTTALGISIFYIARGIGTFIGPIVTRALTNDDPRLMRRAILFSFASFGSFYMLLSLSTEITFAFLCVVFAHVGGSTIWVFTNVLMQMEVKKEIRGRVFGWDLGLATLTSALATLLYGYLIEDYGMSVRTASLIMGSTLFIGFFTWLRALLKWFRSKDELIAEPQA